tara:strand:- start:269 stop:400 length:132 start_codon:yes stop_codon:yes gene_type:complete
MNNAVAIIGGTGQFGLTLAEKLIKKNHMILFFLIESYILQLKC